MHVHTQREALFTLCVGSFLLEELNVIQSITTS